MGGEAGWSARKGRPVLLGSDDKWDAGRELGSGTGTEERTHTCSLSLSLSLIHTHTRRVGTENKTLGSVMKKN